MQKIRRRLSVCIAVVALCGLLPSCTTFKPAPVYDSSLRIDQQRAGKIRTYSYVVKSGDTLYAISKLHGLTVAQIAEMNGLEPPYTIVPNQMLVVTPSRVLWQENIVETYDREPKTVSEPQQSTQTKRSLQTSPPRTRQPLLTVAQTLPSPSSNSANPTTNQVPPPSQSPESGETTVVSQSASRSIESLPKGWEWPVNSKPTKGKTSDDGLSYLLSRGTNVVAAASGRISYAGVALSDYRYMVLVKTPDNYVIQYDFNAELAVKENDIVSKGQPLIRISERGVPKGEDKDLYRRLYFAIWRKAVPQDPNELIGL